MLTTQLYIKGFPQNEKDGIFKSLKGRDAVTADFKPLKDSKIGELTANFEVVLGATPEEPERGGPGGRPPGR